MPGIKIVCPATAYDAKGLLKAAIRDDNPVLMIEHKLLYGRRARAPSPARWMLPAKSPMSDYIVPIRQGIVRRAGSATSPSSVRC